MSTPEYLGLLAMLVWLTRTTLEVGMLMWLSAGPRPNVKKAVDRANEMLGLALVLGGAAVVLAIWEAVT